MIYQPRRYRSQHSSPDLVSFTVSIKETNLFVSARCDLERKTRKLVLKYRAILEKYIGGHPEFLTSLEPIKSEPDAPRIVHSMIEATSKAGVGPMASVAGAIAQFIGEELSEYSPDIIIENGGDIYINSTRARLIGIYAGDSHLSGKIGIEIAPGDTPCGICTSSGTVGHSLSFGKADAVTIVAPSTALADAVATACGNIIQTSDDIEKGIAFAKMIKDISGTIIIVDDRVGAWGDIRLKRL